jgi:hypothetical protein
MQQKLSSGMTVTTYSPAHGFDPLTADVTDLVKAGFPARPGDPRHLARFNQVLGSVKGKFNYVTPTLRENPGVFHGPRKRPVSTSTVSTSTVSTSTVSTSTVSPSAGAAGTETSTNWSGGVAFAPSGETFRWVEGDWVIPNVDAPAENRWYYCASWIGIDGDGSGDVCQIGVECEAYRSGTSVTTNIYPWFEWFPYPETAITNFPVRPGDLITALLCTSGAGATSASAYFTNRTTGASTSLTFTAPSGTSLTGNSAEWVVEAPTVGGSQSLMADYGEVFFSVCEAVAGDTSGHTTTVYGGAGDNINMNDGSGHEVSAGTLITPTVIQCEYVGTLP